MVSLELWGRLVAHGMMGIFENVMCNSGYEWKEKCVAFYKVIELVCGFVFYFLTFIKVTVSDGGFLIVA